MSNQKEIYIGIDLGTTNSCVAYYLNERVKVLENKEGQRITPSYVYYSEKDEKHAVGKYAKELANKNPKNGIYEIKRLIGRKLSDPKVKENIENLYYDIDRDNQNDEILVLIKQSNQYKKRTPVEICATILSKIKSDIVHKYPKSVSIKAVITIPAYFNVSQRKETLEAANKSGFTVLKLLSEPTAAALSFFLGTLDNNITYSVNDHFLVYDLGGGTFDVAILKKTKTNVEVIGVDGDTQLGGRDIDNLIVKYVCKVLREMYKYDKVLNEKKLKVLQEKCEAAKEKFINLETTEIILRNFIPGNEEIEIELTRNIFDEIANDLFQKTIQIVDSCLKNCHIPKNLIKQVILAGGSTRILRIQKMIQDYFQRDCINKSNHLDECVAEGAAIQAAMFSKQPQHRLKAFSITDITPLSIGICTITNLMSVCIPKHTKIPFQITKTFSTTLDKQKTINFDIYEGERSDARKNHYLGEFTLQNLTPTPPGQCQILLAMKVNTDGILEVTARETTDRNKNFKFLNIMYARGTRNDGQKDTEENKLEDKQFESFAKLKEYFLLYCEGVKYNIFKRGLQKTYEDIFDLCEVLREGGSHIEVDDKEELEESINLIESKSQDLVNQYKFELMPLKSKYIP